MQRAGRTCISLTFASVFIANGAMAQPAAIKELPPRPTVADVIKESRPGDWRPLDPANTLYMELPGGRVVIELAPGFAPQHAANIRLLARDQYFDGLAVIRSQENYVVQWGDADEKNPRPFKTAKATLPAEFTVPASAVPSFVRLPDGDVYAAEVGHANGFPVARDPKTGQAWLTHCYGMVGVGRDTAADSGGGSSLYVVIGHAPRHLDRNITVVGRVVAGMPLLTTLPRGTGALGFYEQPSQYVPISTLRVAADVPAAQRSRLEVMRTESPAYQKVLEAQRNRGGPWTKFAAGKVDLCNAPIPVRPQP
jgi:cyclophilin family peptidyl-prolyl cis-trans isomerase